MYAREREKASGNFTRVGFVAPGSISRMSRRTHKSIDGPAAKHVRQALLAFVARFPNQLDAAKRLGVSQQHISRMVRADNPDPPGIYVAIDLARELGMTFEELTRGQEIVIADERYPNRAEAAAFARKSGISEEAIANVNSMALKSDSDLTPLDWLEEMKTEDRRIRREAQIVRPTGLLRAAEPSPPEESPRERAAKIKARKKPSDE